jgi:hypothetical protein
MTPADLRAIAARVMAGEDGFRFSILKGMGWEYLGARRWLMPAGQYVDEPDVLHSLDAADLLMRPFGFNVAVTIEQYLNANWIALAYLLHANGDCERVEAIAPTEPRARTALALLCRAAEGEA